QLRVHDGAMYVRAYSLQSKGPRTFRVVQIRSIRRQESDVRVGGKPPADDVWGQGAGVGVDDDRPGVATIRVTGAYARWVELECWDDSQQDRWSADMTVLERRVEYRSCREFARRLLSLGDGLLSVEPAELREEVSVHATALAARVASLQMRGA
ncbi:MAG: WYL domain-containing protein, partial [Nannocystaceae bacterium]